MKSLTSEEFNSEIQSFIPVLIEFWDVSCKICAKAEIFMNKLEQAYKGKLFIAKINLADALVLLDLYSVSKLPTFILFRSGRELTRSIGFRDEITLEKTIREFIK